MSYEQLLEKLKQDLFPQIQATQHSAWPWWVHWAIIGAALLVATVVFSKAFYTVSGGQFIIIERFGKYRSTALPGLHFKIPFIDTIRANWTHRIMENTVKV